MLNLGVAGISECEYGQLDIVIGQWSLSNGELETLHTSSDVRLREHIERSIAVLLWEAILVGSPVFITNKSLLAANCSIILPRLSYLSLPHMGLWALKSPRIKQGCGNCCRRSRRSSSLSSWDPGAYKLQMETSRWCPICILTPCNRVFSWCSWKGISFWINIATPPCCNRLKASGLVYRVVKWDFEWLSHFGFLYSNYLSFVLRNQVQQFVFLVWETLDVPL